MSYNSCVSTATPVHVIFLFDISGAMGDLGKGQRSIAAADVMLQAMLKQKVRESIVLFNATDKGWDAYLSDLKSVGNISADVIKIWELFIMASEIPETYLTNMRRTGFPVLDIASS